MRLLLQNLLNQMKNNAPITIFGDGLQTRDFIHVNDVVQANLSLALAPVPKEISLTSAQEPASI